MRHSNRRIATTAFLSVLAICTTSVHAFELKQQIKVDGQTLLLNGAGSRSKAFIQLYESGLYLLNRSNNSAAIIAADQYMAIRVKITSGFVSQSTLRDALNEGLSKSTGGNTGQVQRETQQFLQCLNEEVRKHDVFDFIHVPKRGLFVLKNGTVKGMIPGLSFKKALFGIWLSDDPADKNLRQAMLSGKLR